MYINYMFICLQADRNVRNLYKLHSVLVHSGGVHGGHYYAYIRPDGKTWLKFDDTAVTIEDGSKALEEQFGGEDEPAGSPASRMQVGG
jgi:ubiquitin carboxyl-terminal hydrolase 7